MSIEVHRFTSLAELSRAAADEVAALITQAIAKRGRAFVALSGGSTPKTMFAELTARKLDWSKVSFFWSDERAVPPDHEDSNFRMAKETLLEKVSQAKAERMHGEDPDLGRAAAEYEAIIAREVPGHVFDLILLGLGPDGHTASLFPGTTALEEDKRLVVANEVPQKKSTRLTFTFPLINAARAVFFLAAGEDKAPALAQILRGEPGVEPAQRVQAARVEWFVDQAAAAVPSSRAGSR